MSEKRKSRINKIGNDLKVLIIDDDYRSAQEVLKGIETAVPEFDLHSHIVYTASEALKEAAKDYDVVFLDLVLSERPGDFSSQRVLEELHRKSPATKFVVYSSYLPESVQSTFNSSFLNQVRGADFIFKKPYAQDILSQSIASTLRDFLPNPDTTSLKPDANLIIPVKQTITVVNNRLASMFLDDPELLRKIDPFLFEHLVAELFEAEGYQIALTPPRADGGKDIYVSKMDTFTHTKFLVECKRYNPPTKVDVKIVRQLYGVVQQERASGGIIVTTSYFTQPAKEFADTVPYQLFLRDFNYLSQWIKKQK